MNCPLCTETTIRHFYTDAVRDYLQCEHCKLVFVPDRFRLSPEDEKSVYDMHQNDPADAGYRNFLSRLTQPLLERLGVGSKGLDFGCGPGPTLSLMLHEAGYTTDIFDPVYHNDRSVLEKQYDFICATEVVEHLHTPGDEFNKLFSMLKSGGWLGIMTKLVKDRQAFSNWHYIRDLTHVCFFSKETFYYLAAHHNAELVFQGSDVILLRTV